MTLYGEARHAVRKQEDASGTARKPLQRTGDHGLMHVPDGRSRVVIEGVEPEIDCGLYPAKRVLGDEVVIEADIFTDGHDRISAVLLHRREGDRGWTEVPMEPLVNDRWRGRFMASELGRYVFTVTGWVDHFKTWSADLEKRVAAGQDVSVDLLIGAKLVEEAAEHARGNDAEEFRSLLKTIRGDGNMADRVRVALSPELHRLVSRHAERKYATRYERELTIVVDTERARFSTWYELFPRSWSREQGRHGTFRDVEAQLGYVASMGFDVIYLPPIHPIGTTLRKGRNNRRTSEEGDVGSPWAIGGKEGGHKAIHPDLGTLEDFRSLVNAARGQGIDIALDVAFQCSPDHPYVKEHPEWFRHRPDGSVQYAENPPKKYEDIYPLNFESSDWRGLWEELKSVFTYWIEQGVRIFRVDNPHTKPFAFWEWAIPEIKREYPDVIFLAEAFTRPKPMYRLAKLGFTQSYTYFTWRHSKRDFTEYMTELTRTKVADFFRPNFWPNTPDILTEILQTGGRPAFMQRYVLAATLAANCGIYGPAFELQEHLPREPHSEEYLNSEKYELRNWDLNRHDSLRDFIARVNKIRRENAALQRNDTLEFHPVDSEQLLCYSKSSPDGSNVMLMVVNLETRWTGAGWVNLNLEQLGLDPHRPFQVHDLLGDARYQWQGPRNFVQINPQNAPAHIFRVRQVRAEQGSEQPG